MIVCVLSINVKLNSSFIECHHHHHHHHRHQHVQWHSFPFDGGHKVECWGVLPLSQHSTTKELLALG